jgi:subtilisin family serine protease
MADHAGPADPLHDRIDTGIGSYPRYPGLWHFDAVGLAAPAPRPGGGAQARAGAGGAVAQWRAAARRADETGRRTRIALIDTPVAVDHPCLAGTLMRDLAIDFALNPPLPPGEPAPRDPAARAETIRDRVREYARRIDDGESLPQSRFPGSHGTSMAGIIGAHPALATLYRPERLGHGGAPTDAAAAMAMPLPYAGLDPTCQILPVSISAWPGPHELYAALEYAHLRQADLIVIATDLPNPFARDAAESAENPLKSSTAEFRERPHFLPATEPFWAVLTRRLGEISEQVPILCAAGNAADEFAYPARLSALHPGIFAVGAVNSLGAWTSYSPQAGVTLAAPSGDAERWDRAKTPRLDVYRHDFGKDEEEPYRSGLFPYEKMPVPVIVATDIPGKHGYNGSRFEPVRLQGRIGPDREQTRDIAIDGSAVTLPPDADPALAALLRRQTGLAVYLDFASNFCLFSGTSAAASVAAGLVSLGLSTGVLPRGLCPAALRRALEAELPTEGPPALSWDILTRAARHLCPRDKA